MREKVMAMSHSSKQLEKVSDGDTIQWNDVRNLLYNRRLKEKNYYIKNTTIKLTLCKQMLKCVL